MRLRLPMFLFFISSLYAGTISGQNPVRFVAESIVFRYDAPWFSVNGIYCFLSRKHKSVSQGITFPFPCRSAEIDTLAIFDMDQGLAVPFERKDSAIHFTLRVSANDTLRLNIFYRQRIHGAVMKYILTTTRHWGEPLQKAVYRFEATGLREDPLFSYPPDRHIGNEHRRVFFWNLHHFMPDRDFLITLPLSN